MAAIIIRIEWLPCAVAALALGAASPAGASGLGYDGAPPHEMCALCHSLDGISRMSRFPRLAGQKAAYIEKQLRDFREGLRRNDGGQMASVVTEIEEAQIAEVAAYFSTLPAPPPIEADAAPEPAAARLFGEGDAARGVPACASCHMPDPSGEPPPAARIAPYLTAQHADYLAKQLRDFRRGDRNNDRTGSMAAIAKALTESEIEALAAWLAARPRKASHDGQNAR